VTYWVQEATERHIRDLAATIAEDDEREAYELDGSLIDAGLHESVHASPGALAWGTGETTLCIYGVAPVLLLPRVGCIWMLASSELHVHARPFLRESKRWVRTQQQEYDVLVNYVVSWYTRSLRWLSWLGFTIHTPPVVLGPARQSWYRVELRGN